MTKRHDVQVGDVWRIRIGSAYASYLILDREGERLVVHHLERDETTFFYDIWFSEKHPDYALWEKMA